MTIENDILSWADTSLETPCVTHGSRIKPIYIVMYRCSQEDLNTTYMGEIVCTKSSMHLVIDRHGEAYQLCPFTTKAWHAGQSYWQGHNGLNTFGIGVALVEDFTEKQMTILDRLIPELVEHYNIRDIVGHSDVSPNCPNDPGPDFPMDRYKPFVEYGNAESGGKYIVSVPLTQRLNVRGGPDVAFSVIDTLETGDGVKVLRGSEKKDWVFISYVPPTETRSRQGWVHESFIRRA